MFGSDEELYATQELLKTYRQRNKSLENKIISFKENYIKNTFTLSPNIQELFRKYDEHFGLNINKKEQ